MRAVSLKLFCDVWIEENIQVFVISSMNIGCVQKKNLINFFSESGKLTNIPTTNFDPDGLS